MKRVFYRRYSRKRNTFECSADKVKQSHHLSLQDFADYKYKNALQVSTVNNKKYSNAEYWGKIPGIFKLFHRYSKMEMFRIYKLFPACSVPEK